MNKTGADENYSGLSYSNSPIKDLESKLSDELSRLIDKEIMRKIFSDDFKVENRIRKIKKIFKLSE